MGFSLKEDMDAGVMESNWLMPIPRILILIGHSLTNLAVTLITSTVMLVVSALLFGFRITGEVLNAFLPVIPMPWAVWFWFRLCSAGAGHARANTMVDMSSFLVQIFSGSNFPVSSLPKWLLPISLALPLTYGLDAVRGFLLKTRRLCHLLELVLLVVFMLVMLWLGSGL